MSDGIENRLMDIDPTELIEIGGGRFKPFAACKLVERRRAERIAAEKVELVDAWRPLVEAISETPGVEHASGDLPPITHYAQKHGEFPPRVTLAAMRDEIGELARILDQLDRD